MKKAIAPQIGSPSSRCSTNLESSSVFHRSQTDRVSGRALPPAPQQSSAKSCPAGTTGGAVGKNPTQGDDLAPPAEPLESVPTESETWEPPPEAPTRDRQASAVHAPTQAPSNACWILALLSICLSVFLGLIMLMTFGFAALVTLPLAGVALVLASSRERRRNCARSEVLAASAK